MTEILQGIEAKKGLAINGAKQNMYRVEIEALIHALEPCKDPDHFLYDPRVFWPLQPAMQDSINDCGVKDPLRIMLLKKEGGKQFFGIVDGKQRAKNAWAVQQRWDKEGIDLKLTVPVIVEKLNEAQAVEAISRSFIRTADEKLNEAKRAYRIFNLTGSLERVMLNHGCNKKYAQRLIELATAPVKAQKALIEGLLNEKEVRELSGLSEKEAAKKVEAKTKGRKSTRESRNKHQRNAPEYKAPNKKTVEGLTTELQAYSLEQNNQDDAIALETPVYTVQQLNAALLYAIGKIKREELEELVPELSDVFLRIEEAKKDKPSSKPKGKTSQQKALDQLAIDYPIGSHCAFYFQAIYFDCEVLGHSASRKGEPYLKLRYQTSQHGEKIREKQKLDKVYKLDDPELKGCILRNGKETREL